MKRIAGPSGCVVLLLALAGLRSGGMPPQPQMEFSPGASNSFSAEWNGIAERTYFFQWSLDLVDWNIANLRRWIEGEC